MTRLAFALLALAGCTEPATPDACDGKCDGWEDGPAWRSLDQLAASEADAIRADLAVLPTPIDPATWKLHREDATGFTLYWAVAAPPPAFTGARREMSALAAKSLIAARTLYRAQGFTVPSAIRVYLVENESESPLANGSVVLGHDAIELDYPVSLVHTVEAGGDHAGADTTTPAHELFHVVQGALAPARDADGSWLWDPTNRWLLESTAVAMEDEVFDSEDSWVSQYREWNQTLPLFGFGCADVCKHEWYQRTLFWKYLETVGAIGDRHAMWQYLIAGADPTKPRTIVPRVDALLGDKLMSHWLRFITLYSVPALRRDELSSELASVPIGADAAIVRVSGATTAFSGDLWPLGGARAVVLDVDPALVGRPLVVRASTGTAPFIATVLDAGGKSLGELTPSSPTLTVVAATRLHVAIANVDATNHAVATVAVEPR